KFWVDTERSLVLRSQVTTRTNGSVTADYVFGQQSQCGLPDSVVFSVDVKRFKIPKAVSADINTPASDNPKSAHPGHGKITVAFRNYHVNKGVDDKVFGKD